MAARAAATGRGATAATAATIAASGGGGERTAVVSLDQLRTAQGAFPALRKALLLTAIEFGASPYAKMAIHEALHVPASCVTKKHNRATKVATLRGLCVYSWIALDTHDTVRHLLNGKLLCKHCYKSGAAAGVLDSNQKSLRRHNDQHLRDGVAAVRQVDLVEAGLMHLAEESREATCRSAVVGSLLAGGDGAAGMPPSAISKHLNKHFLHVLQHLRSGMPKAPTIAKYDAPAAVARVEDWIRRTLKHRRFAIGVDGGASYLAHGAKVIAVVAMSPELEFDITLDVVTMGVHETAATLASAMHGALMRYAVKNSDSDDVPLAPVLLPRQVRYIVSDNASVGKASVDLLCARAEYKDAGWAPVYVRCLPHCLNLVMVALLAPWDKRFRMSSFLKEVRGFIKAGGGVSRRMALLEYAVSLSRIDFADTRWESFINALKYMMDEQTPYELKAATSLLERQAALGDEGAVHALAEPGAPQLHWNALYEALESIGDGLASGDMALATMDGVLAYLSDISNFAAFVLLARLLSTVTGVFKLIQGGSQWTAKLRTDLPSSVPTAASSVTQLLDRFNALYGDAGAAARDALIDEVISASVAQQDEMLRRAKEYNEPIVKGATTYREGDLTAARLSHAQNISKTREWLYTTLADSLEALHSCPGMGKMREALAALQVKQRFDLSHAPSPLPSTPNEVYDLLGVPSADHAMTTYFELRDDWALYMNRYRAPPEGHTYAPAAVAQFWTSIAAAAPRLSALALEHWLRPVGNAAVERVFSTLSDMDTAKRRAMTDATLMSTLYLRSNQHIMRKVLEETDAAITSSGTVLTSPDGTALGRRLRAGADTAVDAAFEALLHSTAATVAIDDSSSDDAAPPPAAGAGGPGGGAAAAAAGGAGHRDDDEALLSDSGSESG